MLDSSRRAPCYCPGSPTTEPLQLHPSPGPGASAGPLAPLSSRKPCPPISPAESISSQGFGDMGPPAGPHTLGPPRPPQGCALIHPVSKLRAEPRAVWALWAQQGTKVPSDHSVPGRSQGKQAVTTLSRPGRTLRGCTGGETEAQTGSFSLWDMQPGNAELRWSPVSFSIRGSPHPSLAPGSCRTVPEDRAAARLPLALAPLL